MTRLGEREQRVRGAALEQNIGLDVGETTSRVEQSPNRVTRSQQQQRIGRQAADIDRACVAKLEQRLAHRQNLIRCQRAALEAWIALIVSDADVNLAAFQHGGLLVAEDRKSTRLN